MDGTPDEFLSLVGTSFGDLSLSLSGEAILAESTGIQMIGPFPFCITFQGREVVTIQVAAPSPEDAAATVEAMIVAANRGQPGWGAFAGLCPTK